MAALHGAITLAQMNHMAVCIGKNLQLYMARVHDGALNQQITVTKARQRFRPGTSQRRSQLLRTRHQPHTTPATASHSLDHDGIAYGCGLRLKTRL